MQKKIFPQQWLDVHPYEVQQSSDVYYVELANHLYHAAQINDIPEQVRKDICVYVATYLEDIVSGLRLWEAFRLMYKQLYGGKLPFYDIENDYYDDEINYSDVCFLIWNTWQKAQYQHPFINPFNSSIFKLADLLMPLLDSAYQEAPENDILTDYFSKFDSPELYDHKLSWLFGHTYLTAPSVAPYIERVTPTDRFIIPTGPLAHFLYEWMSVLSTNDKWRQIKGIIPYNQPLSTEQKEKNRDYYSRFTAACGGRNIVYLENYLALRRFFVDVLGWKDDDAHTLPHMKQHRNFILMSNPEKGILLAKDICEWIADPINPMYNQTEAANNAIRLLQEETLCPPDLLTYCIRNGYLPDAQIATDESSREWIVPNADFIARHTLLYYYRGD